MLPDFEFGYQTKPTGPSDTPHRIQNASQTKKTGVPSGLLSINNLAESSTDLPENSIRAVIETETIPSSILSSSIRGRVVDEQSDPVNEAEVTVESAIPDFLQPSIPLGDHTATVYSDADGRFSIPVPEEGAFMLHVKKEGFAPSPSMLALPDDDIEIELEAGLLLTGLITDIETETPVQKALIRASNSSFSSLVESEADGTFRFTGLPQEKIDLEVFHGDFDLKKLDALFIHEDKENFVKVPLKAAPPLNGIVLDADSAQPVAAACVTFAIGYKEKGESREVYREELCTDEKGMFHFEKMPTRGYRLLIRADGYSTLVRDSFSRMKKTDVVHKIYLKKEGAVAGMVFDPDGRPVENAEVRVFQSDLWEKKEIRTVSDKSGEFLLKPVGAGEITILVSHQTHAPVLINNLILLPGETIENIEIVLSSCSSFEGRVYKPDGSCADGARIVIDGVKPVLTRVFQIFPIALSDSEGCFSFKKLSEGEYRISAVSDELRSVPEEIVLGAGENKNLTLSLADGLSISGTVCDCFGAPLDDVLVTVVALASDPSGKNSDSNTVRPKKQIQSRLKQAENKKSGNLDAINNIYKWNLPKNKELTHFRGFHRSGEDGRFLVNGLLPDDILMVRFWKHDFNGRIITDIVPDEKNILIELLPLCNIHGQVVDSSTYLPLTEFFVTLSSGTFGPGKVKNASLESGTKEQNMFFRTDDGSFRLNHVKPGSYTIQVSAKGFQKSRPIHLSVAPDHSETYLNFRLDRSGTLKGRVQAFNKSPLIGISVYLRPDAPSSPKNQSQKTKHNNKPANEAVAKTGIMWTRTDDNGQFVFLGLKPAVYDIVLGNPQKPVIKPKQIRVHEGKNNAGAVTLDDLGNIEITVQEQSGFSLASGITITGGPANSFFKVKTGKLGHATLSSIVPGKYRLIIQSQGYVTLRKTVLIKRGDNDSMEFHLSPKTKK